MDSLAKIYIYTGIVFILLIVLLLWATVNIIGRECGLKAEKIGAYTWEQDMNTGCMYKLKEGDRWVPMP